MERHSPKYMCRGMLENVYIGHMKLQKCKLQTREIMFWPNINIQLEDYFITFPGSEDTHRKQNDRESFLSNYKLTVV